MEMVKTELFYVLANNKRFSSVYWKRGCVCICIKISGPLVNKVTVKHYLLSIFKLANLNKLEPRQIGREDLWPALEFLILRIWGGILGKYKCAADTVAGEDKWE